MSDWMTAAELAGLGLPRFPASPQGVNKRAITESWPRRRRADATHAWEYRVAAILPTLDDAAREILRHSHAHQIAASLLPAPAVAVAVAAHQAPVEIIGDTTWLTNSQRAIMDARAAILAYVDRLAHTAGSITQARQQVESQARAGKLPPEIARLLPVANAKAGKSGKRTISLRTLINWHTERATAGGKAVALAPKAPEPDMSVPAWAPALLALNGPQNRSLREIVEKDLAKPGALPMGVAPPSYGQARRWLSKVSTIERNRGRLGPKELKSLMPYVKRDLSGLDPLDIVQSDGHCLDAEILHPRHGKPFRPEITSIIDLATRMCVGWSAGLAENALGVGLPLPGGCAVGQGCQTGWLDRVRRSAPRSHGRAHRQHAVRPHDRDRAQGYRPRLRLQSGRGRLRPWPQRPGHGAVAPGRAEIRAPDQGGLAVGGPAGNRAGG